MKKFFTITTILCMLLSSIGVCYAAVTLDINSNGTQTNTTETQTNTTETKAPSALFSDTNASDWYYPHMEMLVNKGGINGYDDGTFKPNDTITNAEFVKIIVGIVNGKCSQGTIHWAENYMNKAVELGIVLTDEYTSEKYDEPMKRQNMAKVVSRTMDKIFHENIVENTDEYTVRITDWEDTCSVCKPDVAQAYAKGVIAGMPDGSFAGRSFATRAEAITMIVRMIDKDYRVVMYGDVPFNEKTDIMQDGRMSTSRSKSFLDTTLQNLTFIKENGKYYISGTFPELPEGFTNELTVTITRKNSPVIRLTNVYTAIEENKLPNTGAFKKELIGVNSIDEIEYAEIFMAINANNHTNDVGYKYGFTGNYRITTVNPNIVTYIKNNGEATEELNYDFSKIFLW